VKEVHRDNMSAGNVGLLPQNPDFVKPYLQIIPLCETFVTLNALEYFAFA
jgi:hypothetical protein